MSVIPTRHTIFSGYMRGPVTVTFENLANGQVRGVATRTDGHQVTLMLVPGESLRGLRSRLEATSNLAPSAESFRADHLKVLLKVRMTKRWIESTGLDKYVEQDGVRIYPEYRGPDGAIFPHNFTGTVLALGMTECGVVARVLHEPEDCACGFANNTICNSPYRCPRCEGTGIATIRFIPAEFLEAAT